MSEQLKEFEIWCEGYRASGNCGKAYLVGKVKARDFLTACKGYAALHPEFDKNFEVESGTPYHWGCQLFDNEQDARKTFG